MSDITKNLAARIPWQCGNTTGYVTVDAKIKGPEPVVTAISKEIRDSLIQAYGADVRILGETETPK